MYFDEHINEFFFYELQPETNLQDFCDAILATLKFWKAAHTNPNVWAESCLSGMEPLDFLTTSEGKIENNYFSVDLRENIIKEWCKDNLHLFCFCPECGIVERGFDCDCDKFDEEYEDCDINDLISWIDEIYFDSLPSNIDNEMVYLALVKAFDVYWENVSPVFENELETISNAIEDIEQAIESGDNKELLAACLAGTQIYHVNGLVIGEYGEIANLEYRFVDNIRNHGLIEYFSEEEIQEFMNQQE